jgi:L-aspartate oxidase
MRKLFARVAAATNITVLPFIAMNDIIIIGKGRSKEKSATGIIAEDKNSVPVIFDATNIVLATGGVGGLYKNSTNVRGLTGDAIKIAIAKNITVKNLDYVQIHPTAFYEESASRRFLISESIRGAGAVLLNKNGERFADELLPRDRLTRKIEKQMGDDGNNFVMLNATNIDTKKIKSHFPNIYEYCKSKGFDITKESIPVAPAQHYFMGGIKVDTNARTSVKNLYAVGETACTGVHGKNRLASNSLLEAVVFGIRAARDIAI